MNTRFSRVALSVLTLAAVALTVSQVWAVYFPLGPSKSEWGLKYEVELSAASGDLVNVTFKLQDEGRLTPVHSYNVVAFRPTGGGSFAYDVKSPIKLTATADGKRVGTVQVRREFMHKAKIRALTLSVDGKRQTAGAAYYDIPLDRYPIKGATPATVAAPSAAKVIK